MSPWILLSLLLAPLWTAADSFSRLPVEVPAMGFAAALADGRVVATWKRYKRDDFSSYRLVKSSTKDSPVYPDEPAIYWGASPDALRFEDGKLSPGAWRYRLCIVTLFGDRWVSPVITITVRPEDLKRSVPTAADFEP